MIMPFTLSDAEWEGMWAPYDSGVYDKVLEQIRPQDVVVDIGAGDLRLARRMAAVARQVIAIEQNPEIIASGASASIPLPKNINVICADALEAPLPTYVTIGILLMRHCTHFRQYAEKLRRAGAMRLVTNARWHLDVETIDLQARCIAYRDAPMGWYACGCGAAGFKTGPADSWTEAMDADVYEVDACPQCEQLLA
jgi:hypothetical protein